MNARHAADDDTTNERVWHNADLVAKRYRNAVTPLFSVTGKRAPDLVGSSVLLSLTGRYFLLTARHVITAFDGGTINAMAPPDFAPITGRILRVDPNADGSDKYDAAVFAIDLDRVTPAMRSSAIGIGEVLLEPVQAQDVVQLVGYPSNRSRKIDGKTLTPTWFQWLGQRLKDEEYSAAALDARLHVAFRFERERAMNERGEPSVSPALGGVSGSGIWHMGSVTRASTESSAKLSAIFTDHDGKRLIGTVARVHLEVIARYYPELFR